jgi:hypothetical protein
MEACDVGVHDTYLLCSKPPTAATAAAATTTLDSRSYLGQLETQYWRDV